MEFCSGSLMIYEDMGVFPIFLNHISYLIVVPGITAPLIILFVIVKSGIGWGCTWAGSDTVRPFGSHGVPTGNDAVAILVVTPEERFEFTNAVTINDWDTHGLSIHAW
jgi:hypothetical protein